MALAEGTTGATPPHKTVSEYAQELAQHVAMQNAPAYGTSSTTAAGGPWVENDPGMNRAMLASDKAVLPQYGQAANLIQAYLANQGSPLANTNFARAVARKSKKYGVDPRLLVAISGAETSLGKDPNAAPLSEHNVWGMGPGIQYGSWGQGAGAVAKNLSENYFHEGLNSIPEISSKWAPVGAANDPNHVNENWSGNVGDYYKQLTNQKGGDPLFGTPAKAGLQELIYDPIGSYFRGNDGVTPGAYGGHETHVHEAATNPRVLLKSLRVGQNRFNLTPGENPFTGNDADPGVHADHSFHYRDFPGTFGKGDRQLGEAIDWTGAPEDMANFFNWVANRYVGPGDYNYGTAGVTANGGGGNWARPATTQDVKNQQVAEQQSANAAGAVSDAAMQELPTARKKKRSSQIEELIAALQGQSNYGLI